MNKEEILAMEAGKKLDAYVAEMAMGIQGWFRYSNGYHPKARHYSTDISAAFDVVHKLNSDGYMLHAYSGEGHAGAGFIKGLRGYPKVEGKMGISEAICKAALLTKLEEGNWALYP